MQGGLGIAWVVVWAAVGSDSAEKHRFISEQERAYIVQSVQSLPPVDSVPWRRLCCHPAFMATYTCHFTVRFPCPVSFPSASLTIGCCL